MTIAPQSRRNFLTLLLGLVGVRQAAKSKPLCGSRRLWRGPVTFYADKPFAKFDPKNPMGTGINPADIRPHKPLQITKIDHEHKVITLG